MAKKKVAKPIKKAAQKAKAPAKPAPKAKAAPKKVAKPVAKAKPAPKPVAKAKAVAKGKPTPKAQPKAKPVAKAKVVAKPAVKAKAAPAKKVVAKPAAKKPDPKVAAPAKAQKPAVKAPPAKKVVAKLTPVAKPKVETKSAAKPAPKAEAQPVKKVEAPKPSPLLAKTVIEKKHTPAINPVQVKSQPKPQVPPVGKTVKNDSVEDKNMADVRYSDGDLKEFETLIKEKLVQAKADLEELRQSLSHEGDNSTDDTSPTFKMMEDGSDTMSREEVAQLASRQEKFIQNLENALLRIKNKTYGICRITGKLIPKERLRLVPHATLSIEAKNMQP
jgi:RNA polymerase-binding transcription factor DksA